MVKAVNKLILEINNTENEYFEKAVLYIRPEKAAEQRLNDKAEDYLMTVRKECRAKEKVRRMSTILVAAAAALSGAAATAAVLILL